MSKRVAMHGVRASLLAAIFAAGFLCGSITHQRADAQMGELGKQLGKGALKKAEGSGGAIGSVVELGTAIVDMQQHLDALQKNVDTLKKVKSALGG